MTNPPGEGQQPQDPYSQPGPPQPGYPTQPQHAPDHPQATTALVLGIVAIVICGGLLSPVAWWIGKKSVNEIDASQGRLGGRGAAQAGYILGIVGTCMLALWVLFFAGLIVLLILGAVGTSTTY